MPSRDTSGKTHAAQAAIQRAASALARTLGHDLGNPLTLLADYDFADPANSLVTGSEARLALCRISWLVAALGAFSGDPDQPGAACPLLPCLNAVDEVAHSMSDIPLAIRRESGFDELEVAASRDVFCSALYLLIVAATRHTTSGVEGRVELSGFRDGLSPRLWVTIGPLPPGCTGPAAQIEHFNRQPGSFNHYRLGAMHAATLAASCGGLALEIPVGKEFPERPGSVEVRLVWRLSDTASLNPGKTSAASHPVCVMSGKAFASELIASLGGDHGMPPLQTDDLDAARAFFDSHGPGTLIINGDEVAPSTYTLARIRWLSAERLHRLWVSFAAGWPAEWEALNDDYPDPLRPLVRTGELKRLLADRTAASLQR